MTSTRLQRAIHARHASERNKLMDSLAKEPAFRRRITRISECASHGRLYLDGDPPQVRLWVHRCGDRLCPLCSKFRARQIARQLKTVIDRCKVVRHVCLTVQTFPGGSLASAIAHLRESFRKLRRSDLWHEHVFGGAYVIEVTFNEKDQRWHPHIHLIYDGTYIDQKYLSSVWEDCTRGSPVVWIGRAGDRHAQYLAKYAGKPVDLHKWPAAQICEYAHVTHGMRMVQCIGSMHGVKLNDSDSHPEPPAVRHMISLAALLQRARGNHAAARQMCQWLCYKYPWFADFIWPAVHPPGDISNDYNGKSSDQVDEVLTHIALFCLNFSTPLPSKNVESVPLMSSSLRKPKGHPTNTLFHVEKPHNH